MFDHRPSSLPAAPGSARVRLLAPTAERALHSGYDIWSPLDFYFSEFRERYLAGQVKGVMTSVASQHVSVFSAFNIVATPIAQQQRAGYLHRQRLLKELRFRYKNAVVRAVAPDRPSARRRQRHGANQALGGYAPAIEDTDRYFAADPKAIAAAADIKALYRELEAKG